MRQWQRQRSSLDFFLAIWRSGRGTQVAIRMESVIVECHCFAVPKKFNRAQTTTNDEMRGWEGADACACDRAFAIRRLQTFRFKRVCASAAGRLEEQWHQAQTQLDLASAKGMIGPSYILDTMRIVKCGGKMIKLHVVHDDTEYCIQNVNKA